MLVPAGWVAKGADIDGEAAGCWRPVRVLRQPVCRPGTARPWLAVAIGAKGSDAAADHAGHVHIYIYTWGASSWQLGAARRRHRR